MKEALHISPPIPWPPSDLAPFFEFHTLGPIASQAASVSRFMASCVGCNNSWRQRGMLAYRCTHAVGTWCTLLTWCSLYHFFGVISIRIVSTWEEFKPGQTHQAPPQNTPLETHLVYEPWKHGHRGQGSTKETARTHNETNPLHKHKMDYSQKCCGNPW